MKQGHVLSAEPSGRRNPTPAEIRARLASRAVATRGNGVADAADLIRAAVLVGLVDRPEGWSVLLTLRAAHLPDHPGQIALPGGRIDPEDRDPGAAALREAEEEIGLPPGHVEIVGRLDTWLTGTGFDVTPIVGLVRPVEGLVANPVEVAEIFEVPLAFIIDPANHQRGSREIRGEQRWFWVLPYPNRHIWGVTAGVRVNLAEALNG